MLITNFASGELSPTLNGRIDLQQYYSGCSYLKNFEIIPTGGIKRRVGTKRLACIDETGVDPANARLIPFIINKNKNFILEFKKQKVTIWEMVNGSFQSKGSFTTDYSSLSAVQELQYAQNYDKIIFCHKDYPPYVIQYTGGTFTHQNMSFDFYPDVNVDDDYGQVMLPKGTDKPTYYPQTDGHLCFKWMEGTTQKTKNYDAGITKAYCVFQGSLWEFDKATYTTGQTDYWHINGVDPEAEAGLFTTATKYPSCVAFYNNRLFFASTSSKPQKVWASCAPDTNEDRYNDFCTYQKYVTVSQIVKEADLHVFTCDISLDNIGTSQTILTNVSQNFTGAEWTPPAGKDITNYYVSGTYIPTGSKVISATATSITIDHACTIAENMTNQVCSIQLWESSDKVTAKDYEYQIVNQNITTADCSFNFELASNENDAIMFLSSGKMLAAGTESSIWSINQDITALNISASMQGRYGSDSIQGQAVASAQIYFAQGKRGIREFYYDSASEAFQTNNIALHAEQMLEESEIVDFDYVTNPFNRLLCLRNDGAISSLLYDKNNGVLGWTRLVRGQGKIKSVAVTRGDMQYDLNYFLVEDNGKYYIELQDNNNEVFLDSWQVYDSTNTDMLAGYTNKAVLWNETTKQECPINNIPDGFITSENDKVYIGYKYESKVKSLPVLTNDATGKKRIASLLVRFLDSYMPVMKYENSEETFSGVEEPYSGIVKMTYPGVYDRDVSFIIAIEKPQNVVILAVNAQMAE